MRIARPSQSSYPPVLALLLLGATWCAPGRDAADTPAGAAGGEQPVAPSEVLAGVDVLLRDSLALVRGRRVGLVTNHTGMSTLDRSEPVSSVDALHAHPEVDLVALYSPEHGLSGDVEAGEKIASGTHPGTGLPVYSLYTDTRKPLPHMLEGVDVLLFDIQDVGARYYTYVYTMALAMEAAGQAGIPFVVLDRPNPISGGLVQGNVLEPAFSTFVGMYPIAMRHGMTPGELARLFSGEFGVEAELHVVPVAGLTRETWYDGTGLPWTPPSPNMPSLESATHYPGTCLFEGTNLSVGRGTERAFQWIGAPWLDGATLAARLNAYGLPGVRFEAATFTPTNPGDQKWPGQTVHGVRFVATDRTVYDPTHAAVAALVEARRLAGDRWEWRVSHFDRLAGTDRLRLMIEEGRTQAEITDSWRDALASFEALRQRYLLYP